MEEFERDEIRPGFRIGFSIDDLEESSFEGEHSFATEQGGFELDSYETAESDDGDDEDEDEEDVSD